MAGCLLLAVLIVLTSLMRGKPALILAEERAAILEARRNPENGMLKVREVFSQVVSLGPPPLCVELAPPDVSTAPLAQARTTQVSGHVHPNCFCPDTDPGLVEYLDRLGGVLSGLAAAAEAPTFILPEPWAYLRGIGPNEELEPLRRACWSVAFNHAKNRGDMAAAVGQLRQFWALCRRFDESGLSLGVSSRQPPVVTMGQFDPPAAQFETMLLNRIPFLARACAGRPEDLLLLQEALEMERAHFAERRAAIFRTYCLALDDTLSGESTLTPSSFEERVRLMWLDRQWKKESAFIRKNPEEFLDRIPKPLPEFIQWQRSAGPFRDLGGMPPLAQIMTGAASVEAHFEAARLSVAVERHIAARGAAPERLEDLVPEFLDSIPVNPLDGNAWQYGRQFEDGYWIGGRSTPLRRLSLNRSGWIIDMPGSDGPPSTTGLRI